MASVTQISSDIEHIRHSFAHILAAAVKKLYPKTELAIGPVIESGFYYDFDKIKISEQDLGRIESEMRKLAGQKLIFWKEAWPTSKALRYFKKLNQPYKIELIKELQKTEKVKEVSMVHTGISKEEDSFLDLCRGGHVRNTSMLSMDGFKLTRVAGAYWRGDEKQPMLTRVYGAAFQTKKDLEQYLWQQEEAKKRDHRILGERLKLFTFAEEVGPGLPLWLPAGTIIREEIEKKTKEVEQQWGYERVATPHIARDVLYKMSGHIPYYADSMYPPMKLDDGTYYLKAMNCPHTHMIYRAQPRSWRELPIRYAEYGTVYRYERSGTLAGLLRVRGFTQNDAHIYCSKDQAEEEFLKVMRLHEFWYKEVFGIQDFYMRLSLPAKDKKKYAGVPKEWKEAVEIVRRAMKKSGLPYQEAQGEAAFYGPKVDFQIRSVIGREETASTNQLDFLAASRFNLVYKDKDGKEKPVYVIHRAPLGSHERFIAFLIEHYAGAFPFWLAPEQIRILPLSIKFTEYAEHVRVKLLSYSKDFRVRMGDAEETLSKRIREGETMKIPYLLIVGEKEVVGNTVSVRERGKGDRGTMTVEQFGDMIKDIAI